MREDLNCTPSHLTLPSVTSLRCRREMVRGRDSSTEGTRHTSPPAISSLGDRLDDARNVTTVYRETVTPYSPLISTRNEMISAEKKKRKRK